MARNDLKPDVILKEFWRDNDRFADLFNTVLFGGKQVIVPENLQEQDTDFSTVLNTKEYLTTLSKTRDIVKKSAYGVDFVIMGIENQMHVHYAMPLRTMIYDALGYLKECEAITKRNRKQKEKMTTDEFLSGLKKTDQLHPIITIVIYYNDTPWDGAFSLRDMVKQVPEEIQDVFCDYKMNLLQVRDSGKYTFKNTDIETVFQVSREIFNENYNELQKLYKNKPISTELATVIGVITESKELVETVLNEEGAINMCTALEKLKEAGREEGRVEGRKVGREEGRAEGRKAQRKLIFNFLSAGASIDMVKAATGLSEEEIQEIRKES